MAGTRIFRKGGVLRISSPGILDGDPIPHRYVYHGANLSPALSWSDPRPETVSVALTCEDPRGLHGMSFTLWILFNIPPMVRSIPEGLSKVPLPPEVPGALQGTNDAGRLGYDGPKPPGSHPAHRYLFRVYALDRMLDLEPGVRRDRLRDAMEGHILETGLLVGTFRSDAR